MIELKHGFPEMSYKPCKPQADNDEIAAQGKRLIIRHSGNPRLCYLEKLEVIVVEKDELASGWVIGLQVI